MGRCLPSSTSDRLHITRRWAVSVRTGLLTVGTFTESFRNADPARCSRRPVRYSLSCRKPRLATDALAKNANNATKIAEGIVVELPSLEWLTKLAP